MWVQRIAVDWIEKRRMEGGMGVRIEKKEDK